MYKKLYKFFYKKYALKAFTLGLVISFLFFIPFIIYNKGYFIYYGDYNVQEIPFYQLAHRAVKSGNIFWDFNTDLGANFIGSYSFYMLGSPFFWLTLPFKNEAVPYLMGPLLMLKFSFSSLFSYMYLKRYVKNKDFAVLGGLLYAFSGFSIYNIFFNHFHEAIVIFPLILYSLDELIHNKRQGFFCFTIFLSCIMNYYFFVGQAVFLIIYIGVRLITKSFILSKKQILKILFEFILGILGSSILLIPSLLAAMQNTRVKDFPLGFSAILYPFEERYIHLLESFFFPPDLPALSNFTPHSEAKWSSISAWLPFFSTTGLFAYINTKKKSWLKTLILILIFMAFVPILNSSFQAFNQAFYTRWFYMLTLMLSLATIIALENSETNWLNAIKVTATITLAVALFIGFMPKFIEDEDNKSIKFGLMDYPDRFWIYVAISLFCLFCLGFIIIFLQNKKGFVKNLICLTSVTIILSSLFIIYLGKKMSYDVNGFMVPYCLNGKKDICLEDTQNCRTDIFNGMDNQAMFLGIPSIQAFHTIVPGSIMEFYPSIGVDRYVKSNPDTNVFGVRGLTSCRWLFDYKDKDNHFDKTLMPGWKYFDTQNNFDIWQNEYFIPYGFTYENYITKEQYKNTNIENRHLLLLKAIVLDKSQEQKYSYMMKHIENIDKLEYSNDSYFEDCINRKNNSCYFFNYDKFGFTAKIENKSKKDKLVFFSIPYEKGWKAFVNDESEKIEKVNIGFMAVKVPAKKDSTIKFYYIAPGLILGVIISAISFFVCITYLLLSYYFKFKKLKKLSC
ncbi:MAG: hypothetical protein RUMPE_01038 [Eubacteriales bacterium SKADARSKE-1]|nr:hypothetical protein [Eubacteriales bacterium SKADARSKE-1]